MKGIFAAAVVAFALAACDGAPEPVAYRPAPNPDLCVTLAKAMFDKDNNARGTAGAMLIGAGC